MGVIARQSIKGALANYLGIAIGFFTTFFIVTKYLTQEEVGLTRVMVDAALLFSSLAQLGTNSSIVRFFPRFKDDDRNHGIFGWSVLLPFIGFTLVAVGFFLFKNPLIGAFSQNSSLFVDYFYLLIPLTFFSLYLTVFETNASVLLRITVPKLVREVGIRLFNLICYILYGKGLIGLDLFVILFCSSYALAMLLHLWYLCSLRKISFRLDLSYLKGGLFKEMMLYTLFMTMTALAGNIPLFNSLFLGAKVGLEITGVYTIASYIANIVEVPYRSLGAISRPMVSQAVKEENWKEVNRLCKQVSLHQFLVSSMIFFFIWINLEALYSIIPHGEDYVSGMLVVFILGTAKIVNSSFSIATDVLNFSRHYPLSLLFIVVLVLSAIALNALLIPLWEANGSALASLFSYLLYFLLLLGFLIGRYQVSLFSIGHLKVLLLIGALFALHYLWRWAVPFDSQSSLLHILSTSLLETLILLVLGCVSVYQLHISKDVNALLDKGIKRISKK